MRKVLVYLLGVLSISGIIFSCIYFLTASDKEGGTLKKDSDSSVRTARVVANGDILIHDALYYTAKKEDGSYDFNPFFEYVKPWIEGADLAIGDFEGTISDRSPLGGYPLFNAPVQIADTMKEVGYDVVDLAHNHILDTGLYGLKYTDKVFKDRGLDTVGVHADKKRSEDKILIKEVNGIKIAILAYAYGYNGMDANLTAEDRTNHLSDLDEEKMKEEIQRAEKEADVTVVMPERGLLMDVTFEKSKDKTTVKTVKAHPTLVYSKLNGRNINGIPLYDYKIMVLEDFINGGKLRDKLDDKMKEKVDVSYKEIMEHVNLQW